MKAIILQLNEEAIREIPDDIQTKLGSKVVRRNMIEKFGPDSFLNASELKYPVVNPDTGEYMCELIYAAYVRSKQYGRNSIIEKAKKLFDNCNCSEKLKITLEDEQVGFIDLLELFEIEADCTEEFRCIVGE